MYFVSGLIEEAKKELDDDGVLSVSTFIALTNEGIDPQELTASHLENKDNG